MNILVMGGTQFLGRTIVEAAVAAGHTVTLFNRGKTGADLFPELEKLRGDRRESDLAALGGRHFDAVIDVCAYFPRVVNELLHTVTTDHYTLISTISVYAGNSEPNQDESAELATLADPTTEDVTGETYGGLKMLCEEAAEANLPGKALLVRSGLIVGPHDPTDRFTYWPVRVARGGDVAAPNNPYDPLQIIDVRDESEWIIRAIEQGLTGAYNVTGPSSVTFGDVIDTTIEVSDSDATVHWMRRDFMESNEVNPWQDMPLWVPPDGDYGGFHRYNIDKAVAAGLTFRSLSDTVAATLDWYATLPADRALKMGISAEREAELVAKLKSLTA